MVTDYLPYVGGLLLCVGVVWLGLMQLLPWVRQVVSTRGGQAMTVARRSREITAALAIAHRWHKADPAVSRRAYELASAVLESDKRETLGDA